MRRLYIAGTGPGSPGFMTAATLEAIDKADIIIGAQRLLDGLPGSAPSGGYADASLPAGSTGRRFAYTRSEQILELLEGQQWQVACLLMSGDTGLFSGTKRLLAALGEMEGWDVQVLPGISSAQYFAARLGKPWQDWRLCSAHGVEVDLPALAAAHEELFLVTGGSNSVGSLCARLCEAGMAGAAITVGERLSYPDERISHGTAGEFAQKNFHQLSVMLVEYRGVSHWPYANTGIPDHEFIRGQVPMTKQEVRAAALAKLRVRKGDLLYDIGAGTGSVSVEMALLGGEVYALEHKQEALELLRQNAARFGLRVAEGSAAVSHGQGGSSATAPGSLHVIEGSAPAALEGLPAPDAAFIGGSGGNLREIISRLRLANPGVRLCVACVTLDTLNEATALLAGSPGFEVCQIAVSRSRKAGAYNMLVAQNPVFLISAGGLA